MLAIVAPSDSATLKSVTLRAPDARTLAASSANVVGIGSNASTLPVVPTHLDIQQV